MKYKCIVCSQGSETLDELTSHLVFSHEFGKYRLAKEIGVSPTTALTRIRRLKGEHSPAEETLKTMASKGTSFFTLKNKLGIDTIREARTEIKKQFPKTLLYEKELPDGDTRFVLIPDGSNHYDWLDSNKNKRPFKFHVNEANNYMYIELAQSLPNEIKIFNLTDTHIGSVHCREELLKSHIKLIEENDSHLAILGGDMFDYLHKNSVGQPWEQNLSPMAQVSKSAKMLMPIANKCIRYQGGNHDRGRGYNLVGADLAEVLGHYLKVPYGYMETTIDINFKGQLFTIITHHGGGKGSSVQAILKETETYKQYSTYFVHAKFSGHVHNAFTMPRNVLFKEEGKGMIVKRSYTIVGGSYEGRTGTYAEEAKYGPTAQDLTYLTIRTDGSYEAGIVPINCL